MTSFWRVALVTARTPLRWRLWSALSKVPGVCPANAHARVIERLDRGVRINAMCRRDLAANGVCWCGKLRSEPFASGDTPARGQGHEDV